MSSARNRLNSKWGTRKKPEWGYFRQLNEWAKKRKDLRIKEGVAGETIKEEQ